ncbi:hypothetical protein BT69DRAFT_1370339 [Atractiella rhizophila]|nr:hypothetical protein BT69DRAFT_1370339 [Atractiella rhizophila]
MMPDRPDHSPENVEVVRVEQCTDAMQYIVLSPRVKKRKSSILCKDGQGKESIALLHLLTPGTLQHGSPIHLSILPSFLAHLPSSIRKLRITFVLPIRFWRFEYGPSKSSYFSVEDLENAVETDGRVNLCITLEEESIKVTFRDTKHHASVDLDHLDMKPFTYIFHLPDNHSEALFEPIAVYYKEEECFVPLSEWEESSIPSTGLGTTIQMSCCPTRTPGISPRPIAQLPIEILSLIFEFLSFDKYKSPIKGLDKEYLVSFQRLSAVCQVWKAVSVAYLDDLFASMKERHARLKAYPNAGRLWTSLQFARRFDNDISVKMAKDVIAGSPNVMEVEMDAFWNKEEAKIVLRAIKGLVKLDSVAFGGRSLRKWKKDEVEKFMWRMDDRITKFRAENVEDSASSTSPGLQLSPNLKRLVLHTYPPLPSLSLPLSLIRLILSNLCPLPPSVSGTCLPPLLEHLEIELTSYWPDGKISILTTPLDLSHLKYLTRLYLDGGEETSNLVSSQLFHTLRNAEEINFIDVWYCVVDWEFTGFVFSDFIYWFFGDRRVKEEGDVVDEAENMKTTRGHELRVQLFFGGWLEEEICKARSTLREFGVSEADEDAWVRESGEW